MARGKGKKHPAVLKAPLSPYMEFVKEERPKVLCELGLAPSQVGAAGKELGRRWHALSKEEREKFEERGKANREAYKIEVEKLGPVTTRKVKKPPSPFILFAKEERAKVITELGVLSVGDMGKELGRRWRNLSLEEKAVHEDRSKKNKKRYETGMEDLEQSSANKDVAVASEKGVPSSDVTVDGDEDENEILAADLGFAKQKFYSWHPALRTGTMSGGTRIKVTYFGTAETGTVDRNKWLPYSEQVEVRIATSRLLKDSGFMKALNQMKDMLNKLNFSEETVTSKTGVGFSALPVGRKLVKLTKEGLKKDEEQNNRFMKEKIVETHEVPYKWRCKDCNWRGKYLHKAKSHARDCGSRVKEQKKRSVAEKYDCSVADCSQRFSLMSKLHAHYRASHYQDTQGHYCIQCKRVFTNWSNFRRHRVSKHGAGESVTCEFCNYSTDRLDNLARHVKKKHGIWQMIFSLVSDIVTEVVEQFNVEHTGEKETCEDVLVLEDPVKEVLEKQSGEVRKLSEYEQVREQRVAEIQAEFRKKFPDFHHELSMLKMPKKKSKVGRVRKVISGSFARRRSSRVSTKVAYLEVDGTVSGEDLGDGDAPDVVKEAGAEAGAGDLEVAGAEDLEVAGRMDLVVAGEEDQEVTGGAEQEIAGGGDHLVAGGEDPEVAGAEFRCLPCGKTFRDRANMERHWRLIHGQRETPLLCPRTWCFQEFDSVAEQRKHKDNCWLLCPYEGCSKTFNRERFFAAHQRAHKIMERRMMD